MDGLNIAALSHVCASRGMDGLYEPSCPGLSAVGMGLCVMLLSELSVSVSCSWCVAVGLFLIIVLGESVNGISVNVKDFPPAFCTFCD